MKPLRLLLALLLALGVAASVSACSLIGGSSAPVATGKAPTGTDGAVNFDERYIAAGTGAKKVDIWFDALCPYCGQFERTNGETIAKAVDDGSVTVRLHPLTFLDPNSNGTGYSTRAAAALTCVGIHDQHRVLDYFRALYTDQPEEGSSGLTDAELARRASALGITDISGCLSRSDPLKVWAQANTTQSVSGPIVVDGKKLLDKIQGTPTVLVDGKQYPGSVTDAKAFEKFLGA
ncbi:DsbA family protein [Leifsonia sp. AG29]|uniref:DsbA family protein n=1 Tax=Leifsonia sp. AG29 TaxID=2598860 RepID=UPI00131E336C|nr:thioredoxin domain-containing protein [Leifsonia sp. AG29]